MKSFMTVVKSAVAETQAAATATADQVSSVLANTPTRNPNPTTPAASSSKRNRSTKRRSHQKRGGTTPSLQDSDATSIPREELLHLSMKLSKRLKLLESKQRTTKEQRDELQSRCTGLTSVVSTMFQQVHQIIEQQGGAGLSVPRDIHGASVEDIRSLGEQRIDDLSKLCIHLVQQQRHEQPRQQEAHPQFVSPPSIKNQQEPNSEMDTTATPTTNEDNEDNNPDEDNHVLDNAIASTSTTAPTAAPPTATTTVTTATTATTATTTSKHQLQLHSLRTSTDQLRKTLDLERNQRNQLSNELTALREQLEHAKVQSEEQILFLKLKLDGQKRQKEEQNNIHSQMLSDHLLRTTKWEKDLAKKDKALHNMAEQLVILQRQLEERQIPVIDVEQTTLLQAQVVKINQAHFKSTADAEEAIGRANQTTIALTEAMAQLEELRGVAEEHRLARVTAQDMLKRLQTSLDTAAAQRGDAFAALDVARLDNEELVNKCKKLDTVIKKNNIDIEQYKTNYKKNTGTIQTMEQEMNNTMELLRTTEENVTLRLETKYQRNEQDFQRLLANEKKYLNSNKTNKHNIDKLKKEYQKKSTKARGLIESKEREIRDMKALVARLTTEVESGRPQERQILLFAQSQAKRESNQKKMKGLIMDLTGKLTVTESKLNAQTINEKKLRTTLQRRIRLQDGVNMEYLRNIVLKYMSLKTERSQRLQLVPALASLLDFSKVELAGVVGANKERVQSWWRAAVEQRKKQLLLKRKQSRVDTGKKITAAVEEKV